MRDPVEAALWDLTARVLVLGLDVILEYGFWTRRERDAYRGRAAAVGARSELHFLDVGEEELLARLAQRNAQLPAGSFWIDETRMRRWVEVFEPPDEEELRPREVSDTK